MRGNLIDENDNKLIWDANYLIVDLTDKDFQNEDFKLNYSMFVDELDNNEKIDFGNKHFYFLDEYAISNIMVFYLEMDRAFILNVSVKKLEKQEKIDFLQMFFDTRQEFIFRYIDKNIVNVSFGLK
jgi:outer membrane receptor for Fe3+-dicitrate